MPEKYCAIIVAAAAPAIPILNTSTNKRSRAIFVSADIPRNHIGVTEFPTALSRQAKKLYREAAASPANIMTRYSLIES